MDDAKKNLHKRGEPARGSVLETEVVKVKRKFVEGQLADLGMERASRVRTLLLGAGVTESLIDVSSLGESDLRVRTADNVPEPRNRRVEISVR